MKNRQHFHNKQNIYFIELWYQYIKNIYKNKIAAIAIQPRVDNHNYKKKLLRPLPE